MKLFFNTLLIGFFLCFLGDAFAQCAAPLVIVNEGFEGPSPITGAVTANIYGGGSYNNASYVLNGSQHGWFNVVNGLSDVDVYDRTINGFCVGEDTEISFWTRHSFGVTNVTYTAYDDLNNVLSTTTLNLTNVYQQITFNFVATTPGVRFVIHCNSTGGSGVDIIVEDLLFTQCINTVSEDVIYTDCFSQAPFDLFSFFTAIPSGGVWSGPSVLSNGDLGTFDPNVNVSGIYSYTEMTNCGPVVSTVDVSLMNTIDLGNDTTLCAGNAVNLDAGPGFETYEWSNGATTQTINVSTPGAYSVVGSNPITNLVANGDFEGGVTSASNNFTTSYAAGSGGAWGLLSNPGEWAITTAANLVHNNFPGCTDHTTGSTNMFVANGASVANTVVWSQTVPVTINTDYLFSFWAMRVSNDPNQADLQLYINGVPIGPVNSTGAICNWGQVSDSWNSGGAVTAVLSIVNQSTSGSGNDFALDDITFSPVCTTSDTIVVSVETPAQIVSFDDPSCNSFSDGAIQVDNHLAVEYSNDGGLTWQVDSFFVNLPAGPYNVCSRSTLGCVICEVVNLADPALVTVTVSNDTLICENGTANLLAEGSGGLSFDYIWSHTGDLNGAQSESPSIPTVYTVIAENENGCQSLPEDISVTIRPPLTGVISINDTICPDFDSDITVEVFGGLGEPYSFVWSSGDVQNGSFNQTLNVSPAVTTLYEVTVSDGCESTPLVLNTTIVVSDLPEPTYTVLNPDQCEPAIFDIVNTTDENFSQYNYWLINGDDQYLNQDTITTEVFMSGQYDLQLIITSFEGCVDSITVIDALNVKPAPEASFTHSPNPVTMFNTTVLFQNTSFYGSTYDWFFENGNPSNSISEDVTVAFPDGLTGTYEVQLITTSELGCTDTMNYELIVLPEVLIYAPNSFTPDGDEFNQTWFVHMEGIDTYNFELLLYNRWGQLIWENHDITVGWDGTFNGKPVEVGVYTWVINTKDILNDNKYTHNGFVNVMR